MASVGEKRKREVVRTKKITENSRNLRDLMSLKTAFILVLFKICIKI